MFTPTCFPESALVLVKPGGSGMLEAFFDLAGKPLFRSTTHLGGAGFIFKGRQVQADCKLIWLFRVQVVMCSMVELRAGMQ